MSGRAAFGTGRAACAQFRAERLHERRAPEQLIDYVRISQHLMGLAVGKALSGAEHQHRVADPGSQREIVLNNDEGPVGRSGDAPEYFRNLRPLIGVQP
jgi:hypothetical protein